jgi:mannose-6-phosphate isomerase-like protein (cupin superfamily)
MIPWTRIAVAVVMLAPAAYADEARRSKPAREKTTQASKAQAKFVTAKDLQFADAPPVLPKGGKMAVLFGDPSKAGPYVIRLKAPDGYKIAPHWHSKDEQLTVLAGTLRLYMGDTMTGEPHALEAGDFHALPGRMHHAAEAQGETIVQITGVGPFDIHYLNPADDPSKSAKR